MYKQKGYVILEKSIYDKYDLCNDNWSLSFNKRIYQTFEIAIEAIEQHLKAYSNPMCDIYSIFRVVPIYINLPKKVYLGWF